MIQLEWARAMLLRDARRDENLIYTVDWAKLPETCGVYVFGRRFGRNFEALYVGQATNGIGARVRQQLKNLPLMLHLKKAKSGSGLSSQRASSPDQASRRRNAWRSWSAR